MTQKTLPCVSRALELREWWKGEDTQVIKENVRARARAHTHTYTQLNSIAVIYVYCLAFEKRTMIYDGILS